MIKHRFQGLVCKISGFSMAVRQKLVAGQIVGNLGHERAWNLKEKKEDDEGIPFYTLLTAGMGYGGDALGWPKPDREGGGGVLLRRRDLLMVALLSWGLVVAWL
jgi:hypothetical protein